MKKLFFVLIVLMVGAAYSSSSELLSNKTAELNGVIIAYSSYVKSVLPFNLGLNITDTEELVTLSISLNGTEVLDGLVNSTLTCKMASSMMESIFASGSVAAIKSTLANQTISCVSAGTKGDVLVSVLNGILGKKYIVIENQGFVGRVVGGVAGILGWFMRLFK